MMGEGGVYVLEIFGSSAQSGYSYKLSGLERDVDSVYTGAAAPLGSCGLRIQFEEDGYFSSTDWTVAIPNTSSASYLTNLNTYELAVEQRDKKIAEAKEAIDLAKKEQTLENATPRNEALDRANAAISQALARLASVDAALSDRVLRAPFAGTITDISVLAGETVNNTPVITLLSEDEFELTSRIPEIDISKVALGQSAEIVFDAESSETLRGTVIFISPLATEIDGVAYFEAKLTLDNPPVWLRAGLNADVNIIVDEYNNVLRLPKRFVITRDNRDYVLLREGENIIEQEITRGFTGNEGYIEVTGLNKGAEVVAP